MRLGWVGGSRPIRGLRSDNPLQELFRGGVCLHCTTNHPRIAVGDPVHWPIQKKAMSNHSPNPDHALQPDSSSSEGSTASLDENLVESVLADARQLLDTLGAENQEDDAGALESEALPARNTFDPGSVATVLDRVENLVDDFEQLDQAVEDQPGSEPFDLTAVASKQPALPEEQVPSHGPNGPEVDLFAAEPIPEPSGEPAVNPALGFDQATDVDVEQVAEAIAVPEEPAVDEPTDQDAPSGDAAVRLEQLLADRLAEEYDVVEDLVQQEPTAPDVEDVQAEGTEPVVHRAMEDPTDPEPGTEFESIQSADHELGLSSTRVIPAVDPESTEMITVPEGPDSPDQVEMKTIEDEVLAPIPSKMVTVAAEEVPSDAGSAEIPEPDEVVASVEADSLEKTIEAEEVATDESEFSTGTKEGTIAELPEEVASMPEGGPVVEVESESVLVAMATLPYRVLPESLHRFVTPLALSLAIWVPITWTFAVVGPQPSAAATENLQPGFEGREEISDGASEATNDALDEKRD